jgi:hypothetical protein
MDVPKKMITCTHCTREYKLKFNYDRHVLLCNLIHMDRRERKANLDGQENTPSPQTLFKIVQELAVRCNKLENEVAKLKESGKVRQTKNIVDELKQTSKPNITCSEWFQSIQPNDDHLQLVFSRDFTEGLKSCIQSHLTEFSRSIPSKGPESYTSVPDSVSVTTPCFATLRNAPLHPLYPLCAFTQKQNTLYNWSGKEWSILSNELLQQYILGIARKFLVIFIRWNNINRSEIDQCETRQDQQITYMFKINSAQSANEKCVREIKKWLCQTFETKLGPTIEYA